MGSALRRKRRTTRIILRHSFVSEAAGLHQVLKYRSADVRRTVGLAVRVEAEPLIDSVIPTNRSPLFKSGYSSANFIGSITIKKMNKLFLFSF